MDYPHPKITLNGDNIEISQPYGEGIGPWDRYTIAYGYGQYSESNQASKLAALMSEVDDRWRKHLGELAAGLDDRVLLSMARAAQTQKLWGALLPIIGLLERAHQQRLLQLPVLREVPMLEAVLDAADSEGLWDRLLPLLPLLDEPAQQALAQAAERLGDDAFGRVFEAVQAGREWGPLLVLLLRLRSQTQDRLRPLIAKLSPQAARQLLLEADQLGVMDRVDALWRRLTLGRPA